MQEAASCQSFPEEVTPKSRQSCTGEAGLCVAGQRGSEPSGACENPEQFGMTGTWEHCRSLRL